MCRDGRPELVIRGEHPWLVFKAAGDAGASAVGARDRPGGRGTRGGVAARRLEVVTAALVAATALMAIAELASLRRQRRTGRPGRHGLAEVRFGDGLVMGLAQCLALVPGTSRSGVTISTGMLAGLDRPTAASFSFLLSLPAVAAAALLEASQQREEILGSGPQVTALIVGTMVAGIVGYAWVRWLLRMLTGHTLWPFIIYRLGLAALLTWSLAAGWVAAPAA